jgi:hypothetical protein
MQWSTMPWRRMVPPAPRIHAPTCPQGRAAAVGRRRGRLALTCAQASRAGSRPAKLARGAWMDTDGAGA